MSDFLLAVVAFLVVLGPLVLIHEFGHFIAARLVGITVLEFGIGFPPRAKKLFEQGGTIFTLNWLPIGGFVRPLGEDFVKPVGENATEEERAAFEKQQADMEELGKKRIKTKSVQEATPLQRIFFMVAGAVMNFIGAFVILVIAGLLGHRAPESAIVSVYSVASNSPAEKISVKPDDVVTAANGKPIKLSTDVEEAAAESKAAGKPLELTISRGMRSVVKPIKLATTPLPTGGAVVKFINDGSPAAAVLKLDDVIIKVDSTTVETTDDLKSYVDANAGKSVQLTIERNGRQETVSIIPRVQPPENQGALGIQIVPRPATALYTDFGLTLLDNNPVITLQRASLFQAIPDAWQQETNLISRVVTAPIEFLKGKLSPAAARPVSAVGIGQMAGAVARQSIDTADPFPILGFAAVISIALGITNLLPIPALDGGRILFVLIEILRGKPMNPEREGLVHLVGLMLLLGLTFLLAINDIIHPINLPLR